MSSNTAERPKAAERIHAAAKDLFHRQGIRATGIEEVCRAADATKMSLYRSFPSKDALVASILEEDAAAYEIWFAEATEGQNDAGGKLHALAEAVARKLGDPAYRGCPLLLAQAEFPDPSHPTHQLVAAHKARMRESFAALAAEAGATEPALVGDMLALLIDGAWSSLPYMGSERAAAALRNAARTILREALPTR